MVNRRRAFRGAEEFDRRDTESPGQDHKLDDVDAAVAMLYAGDKRLVAAKALREVGLRQSRGLPRRDERSAQCEMAAAY